MKYLLRKMAAALPEPQYTRLRNRKIFEWMNARAPGTAVLNLGSGVGRFDGHLTAGLAMVRMDVDPAKPGLDLAGDAHALPFRDSAFDVVYSIAVLEHLPQPWTAADEITRVLRPGGHVVLELPFLNIIHDEKDYFRFTDRGIQALFGAERYETVLSQVGSGGGSFLAVFMQYYFRQFVPTGRLKGIWDLAMRYPFSLLRFLDVIVDRSPDLRLTANSFSYIGRKR